MVLKDLEKQILKTLLNHGPMTLKSVWRILYDQDKRISQRKILIILDKLFRKQEIKRIIIFKEIYPDQREQIIKYEAII